MLGYGPVGRDGEDHRILTMLQPIRIPISIFIALIPSIAASQIHSDGTANLRDTERNATRRSENGPSARSSRRQNQPRIRRR